MLDETLARARVAEASVKALEEEKKAHNADCSKRLKDLEGRCREAEEKRAKADSEYQALRGLTAALSDGWKKDVKELRKEQTALKLVSERDCNDARSRQATGTEHTAFVLGFIG
jgi:predicted  nucleic acid-binding Zn-ribbon protein